GAAGVDALAVPAASTGAVKDRPFAAAVEDFYFTNAIARSSKTMAECAAQKARLDTPLAAE
ncbi:MAG: hypothetical protein AAFQ67_06655, partial [Pseudomonadota bacterium]